MLASVFAKHRMAEIAKNPFVCHATLAKVLAESWWCCSRDSRLSYCHNGGHDLQASRILHNPLVHDGKCPVSPSCNLTVCIAKHASRKKRAQSWQFCGGNCGFSCNSLSAFFKSPASTFDGSIHMLALGCIIGQRLAYAFNFLTS